jgi:hypothetical protein
MTTADQTATSKGIKSVSEEMQKAFNDWVNKLRFMKDRILKQPKVIDLEGESPAHASTLRPTGTASSGVNPDNQGGHR